MDTSSDSSVQPILIVDDSRVQLEVLNQLLRRDGYHVLTATNGRQALQVAREHAPALVISDVEMPEMNGYQLCRTIKDAADLRHIPVVLLTTLSDPENIVLGLQAKADYYLTKPYDNDYMLARVQELIAARRDALANDGDETGSADHHGTLEVTLGGKRHLIDAGRRQMLNLLLSTYESSVQQNRELTRTNRQLIQAQVELTKLNAQLHERTDQILEQQEQLHEANERLLALATTDGLTGLKNHRAFKEKAGEEVERVVRYGAPLSLLLMDVDAFKSFNDTFGHPAGDEVLQSVGRIVEDAVRSTDFVARYGGEEFVVLLPNTDMAHAWFLAERVRKNIQGAPWPLRPITVSSGLATLTPSQISPGTNLAEVSNTLIDSADKAMYRSKVGGRNKTTRA